MLKIKWRIGFLWLVFAKNPSSQSTVCVRWEIRRELTNIVLVCLPPLVRSQPTLHFQEPPAREQQQQQQRRRGRSENRPRPKSMVREHLMLCNGLGVTWHMWNATMFATFWFPLFTVFSYCIHICILVSSHFIVIPYHPLTLTNRSTQRMWHREQNGLAASGWWAPPPLLTQTLNSHPTPPTHPPTRSAPKLELALNAGPGLTLRAGRSGGRYLDRGRSQSWRGAHWRWPQSQSEAGEEVELMAGRVSRQWGSVGRWMWGQWDEVDIMYGWMDE